MRKSIFIYVSFLAIVLCCFSACHKDMQSASVVGTWNWVITYTDASPSPQTPQSTGDSQTLTLYANKTWKTITNNNTIDSGTYTIGQGRSYDEGYYNYDSLAFYQNGEKLYWWPNPYEIKGDTLIMSTGFSGIMYGGGSVYWVRESF